MPEPQRALVDIVVEQLGVPAPVDRRLQLALDSFTVTPVTDVYGDGWSAACSGAAELWTPGTLVAPSTAAVTARKGAAKQR